MSASLPALLEGLCTAAPELTVSGIAVDSRRVAPGDLFLAAQGVGGRHGLDYVEQAVALGAAAVAWEPAPGVAAPQLEIPDVPVPQLAHRVGEIASRFHGRPADGLFTVGVTGTDGKTSTAWLVAQALEQLGRPCLYLGTLGAGRLGALEAGTHTTPDAVSLQARLAQARDEGVRAVAMEVSSHALDQDRVAGMRFDAAVLTNLTRDHLDYHGSEAAYAEAKARLFERYCRGVSVLNRDDLWGRRWAGSLSNTLVYGLDGADESPGQGLLGRALVMNPDGLQLRISDGERELALRSRLLGRFNAYNLLAAAAALRVGGLSLEEIVEALAAAQTVPGRMEGFHRTDGGPLVIVDYAHTPNALASVLRAAREHGRGRLTLVFGCGGDRDRGKRPLMGATARELADTVIVTDDNPRSEDPAQIVAEILGGQSMTVIHDRALAIAQAIDAAADGDVVVIAGKGHETTQTYGAEVRAFSDRDLVADRLGLERRP
jgi:UDP-N-acetylmuramoyl-L-alanyl-D-glutamate--2,6-diaminopimelate ligase